MELCDSDDITAVLIEIQVFWDAAPCRLANS